MGLRFHRVGFLLGSALGIAAGAAMVYFVLETGAHELVFPAFILWLIVPALLSKALRRPAGEGAEEE